MTEGCFPHGVDCFPENPEAFRDSVTGGIQLIDQGTHKVMSAGFRTGQLASLVFEGSVLAHGVEENELVSLGGIVGLGCWLHRRIIH